MTLGLALIMILLIGVMGAGIVTFAMRDLNTVTEQNRGQRAFEVADAGIAAAKRQLSSDCATNTNCKDHYDGTSATPDIQWSAASGGLTLNDLDGTAGTPDSVNVTISPKGTGTYDFKVISTGTYGSAKRKIEAIFKGLSGGFGGSGLGHPIYYTPSAIEIESNGTQGVTLDEISMFSEKDILFQDLTTPSAFAADYNDPNTGLIKRAGGRDELGDWNSQNTTYFANPGPWNTRGRIQTSIKNFGKKNESVQNDPFIDPGFAAELKICGFTSTYTNRGVCPTDAVSIADGVSSYDSTTGSYSPAGVANTNPPNANGPRPVVLNSKNQDVATKCTFMSKPFPTTSPASSGCYISYPFPRPTPKPDRLKQAAQQANTPTDRHYWDVATDGTPNWNALFPACTNPNPTVCLDRLVFVDAQNTTLNYNTDNNARNQGILVVWCGNLQLNQSFKGVILNLEGDGSAFGASSCGTDKGIIRNNSQFCQCWLYAQGGTPTYAGIQLAAGSTIKFLPGADWNFLEDLFQNSNPTSFQLQGWRELYQ
jgi:hypothetical protein